MSTESVGTSGISEQDLVSKEMDGGAHREATPSHSS